MMKNIKLQFLFLGLGMLGSLFCYSQAVDSTASALKQPVQYVKMEIGMHILDCPVLPNALKTKLMALKGIKDYTIDQKTQSILFNVPEGAVTKEQLDAIARGCSFPAKSVNVLMDSKPFVN